MKDKDEYKVILWIILMIVMYFLLGIIVGLNLISAFTISQIPDLDSYYKQNQTELINQIVSYANNNSNLMIFTGDVVNDLTIEDYTILNNSLSKITIPYLIAEGNHDIYDNLGNYKPELFKEFIGNKTYELFEFENIKIGVLVLPYLPDETELIPFNEIAQNNSDYQFIVITHNYKSYGSSRDYNIFEYLVKNNSNIFMVLSGGYNGNFAEMYNNESRWFYEILTGDNDNPNASPFNLSYRYYNFIQEENKIISEMYSPILNQSFMKIEMNFKMFDKEVCENKTIEIPKNITYINELNETITEEILVNETIEECYIKEFTPNLTYLSDEPDFSIKEIEEPIIEPEYCHSGCGGGGSSSYKKPENKTIQNKTNSINKIIENPIENKTYINVSISKEQIIEKKIGFWEWLLSLIRKWF